MQLVFISSIFLSGHIILKWIMLVVMGVIGITRINRTSTFQLMIWFLDQTRGFMAQLPNQDRKTNEDWKMPSSLSMIDLGIATYAVQTQSLNFYLFTRATTYPRVAPQERCTTRTYDQCRSVIFCLFRKKSGISVFLQMQGANTEARVDMFGLRTSSHSPLSYLVYEIE